MTMFNVRRLHLHFDLFFVADVQSANETRHISHGSDCQNVIHSSQDDARGNLKAIHHICSSHVKEERIVVCSLTTASHR
jgi:hypothetical protein